MVLAGMLALIGATVAQASGPQWDYTTDFSQDQWAAIAEMYEAAEFHGLSDADRDLFLRLGYRETRFCEDITGDFDIWLGRDLSIGCMQWREQGVWTSTPCMREYGWPGRWNRHADLWCGAWAIKHGYSSHWRPWEQARWLWTLPKDPRMWLWDGPHPPSR